MLARTHIRLIGLGILLSMGVLLSSCRPDGVLSSNKMVIVMTDLHRLDGVLQVKSYLHGQKDEEAAYYDAVLSKHGVTRAEFDSSLVWYTHHPQRFNKLYPRVLKNLQEEHALYEDESAQILEQRRQRKQHFKLFTCERVMQSLQHGYPLTDYRLPPIDTLDVTVPLLIRLEAEKPADQEQTDEQQNNKDA